MRWFSYQITSSPSRKSFNTAGTSGGSLSSGSSDPPRFPTQANMPVCTVAGNQSRRFSSSSQSQWWQCKPGWSCNQPRHTLLNLTRFGPNRPVREPSLGSSDHRRAQILIRASSCTRRGNRRENPLF